MVTGQVLGLKKAVTGLAGALTLAFSMSAMNGYVKEAVQSRGKLEKEFLVLRLALGKLKAAVGDAVTPLAQVLIPIITQTVWAATRLVKSVGKVIAALFGYESSANAAAGAQQALTESSDEVKRSLMGFDELNRLEGVKGIADLEEDVTAQSGKLSSKLQAIVDKIMALTAPLREIDLTPAAEAFHKLKEAIAPISRTLFAGLEWAWFNLLVPLAEWTAENFLPVFLEVLTVALELLNNVIVALKPAASWLWENFLKPLGQWAGEKILAALGWLRERLDSISTWIAENRELAQKIASAAGVILLINGAIRVFNSLSGASVGIMGGFGNAMGGLTNPMSLVSGGIKTLCGAILLLSGNWDGLKNTASTAWNVIKSLWGNASGLLTEGLFGTLTGGMKNTVNGIIGFLNLLISGVVKAINGVVNMVNKLQFTVPDWVPGLGGKRLGFQLKTITAPQIPYLAQGAVLPANKPFMAVVGDQKHGTNVEAPLATIQQAVALVMEEQTAALMAGFSASVEVQRDILQAVLGIRIGDDVIGNAVSRYQQKMAVVSGGVL